jgi:alanine racemase
MASGESPATPGHAGMIWQGRPASLEIDLTAVAANTRAIKSLIGPRCEVMAVVKANAYGLGAAWIAQAALAGGATRLGVACVDEGIELRKAGFTCPILVLGYSAPSEAVAAVENALSVTIHRPAAAEALELAAVAKDAPARSVGVHIKVDTGMGRFGCLPVEAPPLGNFVVRCPHLRLEGLMTHFAEADADDLDFTKEQLARFQRVVRQFEVQGMEFSIAHSANSAAALALPESRFDMVRVGILLAGNYPDHALSRVAEVKPAVTLRSRIARLFTVAAGGAVGYWRTWVAREASTIGLVPMGYADGYPRVLSNRGYVLVRGQRCPVVGRVSMDQITVDVTGATDADEGDEVVLVGRQGNEYIGVDELAKAAGTISYEILTGLAPRLLRRYIRDGDLVGVCNLLGCRPGEDFDDSEGESDYASG